MTAPSDSVTTAAPASISQSSSPQLVNVNAKTPAAILTPSLSPSVPASSSLSSRLPATRVTIPASTSVPTTPSPSSSRYTPPRSTAPIVSETRSDDELTVADVIGHSTFGGAHAASKSQTATAATRSRPIVARKHSDDDDDDDGDDGVLETAKTPTRRSFGLLNVATRMKDVRTFIDEESPTTSPSTSHNSDDQADHSPRPQHDERRFSDKQTDKTPAPSAAPFDKSPRSPTAAVAVNSISSRPTSPISPPPSSNPFDVDDDVPAPVKPRVTIIPPSPKIANASQNRVDDANDVPRQKNTSAESPPFDVNMALLLETEHKRRLQPLVRALIDTLIVNDGGSKSVSTERFWNGIPTAAVCLIRCLQHWQAMQTNSYASTATATAAVEPSSTTLTYVPAESVLSALSSSSTPSNNPLSPTSPQSFLPFFVSGGALVAPVLYHRPSSRSPSPSHSPRNSKQAERAVERVSFSAHSTRSSVLLQSDFIPHATVPTHNVRSSKGAANRTWILSEILAAIHSAAHTAQRRSNASELAYQLSNLIYVLHFVKNDENAHAEADSAMSSASASASRTSELLYSMPFLSDSASAHLQVALSDEPKSSSDFEFPGEQLISAYRWFESHFCVRSSASFIRVCWRSPCRTSLSCM